MTRARQLSKLSSSNVFTVDTSNNIGVGSTTPDAKLDVIGIVSATSFYGDGANLTGLANTTFVNSEQINVSGFVTATTFSGNLSGTAVTATTFVGDLTGNADTATSATSATSATNASGLTGTPDVSVKGVNSTGIVTAVMFSGNITGTAATFSGDMSVGGTLTYEDVTNIDSIGIVTARTGIAVLGAGVTATGIGTFHSGLNTEDILAEEVNVTAGKLSDNTNINVEDGMVHLFTTAESTTSTPNIRYNGSVSLNDRMSIGQSIVVTLITTANASAYSANITIDGSAVTENWIGGSAPSAGGSSGVDVHTFTIIKTASATFTVIGNHSTTS